MLLIQQQDPIETLAAISASLIRAPGGIVSIDATGLSGGAGGNATPFNFNKFFNSSTSDWISFSIRFSKNFL